MKLLIAGGGIGGLTLLLAAHHFSLDAELVEQAPEFTATGAGIQLSPNAMKVLRALGLEDALSAAAFCPKAAEIREGVSGRVLASIPLGARGELRWGAPYLHIHRADLIRTLIETAEARTPGRIRSGAKLARYETDGPAVRITLADGQILKGDALIGADGLHSTVRARMLGPDQPRHTGQIAWRATVPAACLKTLPPPAAAAWIGKGRHGVTYFVRGGQFVNFVGVVERDADAPESWTSEGARADALADFAGWHPVLTGIIEAASQPNQWSLYDRDPLPRWTDGPVALLGDACHPMLPFLAQGAAMAIEDAYTLAVCLRSNPSVQGALQAYQSRRLARTAHVQAASAANRARFHNRSLLQRAPLAIAGAMPALAAAQFDWLYGFDAVKGA